MINVLKTSVKTLTTMIGQNKSSVATGMAIAGVIFTGFASGRAALEVDRSLTSLSETIDDPTFKDKAVAVAPHIIVPTMMALATTGLIIFAHRADLAKQVALASAVAVSESKREDITNKAMEFLGEEKGKEFKESIENDALRSSASFVYIIDEDGILFYDPWLDRKLKVREERLEAASGTIAKKMVCGDSPSVNDFYYEIGGPIFNECILGESYGWNYSFDAPPSIHSREADVLNDGHSYRIFTYEPHLLNWMTD